MQSVQVYPSRTQTPSQPQASFLSGSMMTDNRLHTAASVLFYQGNIANVSAQNDSSSFYDQYGHQHDLQQPPPQQQQQQQHHHFTSYTDDMDEIAKADAVAVLNSIKSVQIIKRKRSQPPTHLATSATSGFSRSTHVSTPRCKKNPGSNAGKHHLRRKSTQTNAVPSNKTSDRDNIAGITKYGNNNNVCDMNSTTTTITTTESRQPSPERSTSRSTSPLKNVWAPTSATSATRTTPIAPALCHHPTPHALKAEPDNTDDDDDDGSVVTEDDDDDDDDDAKDLVHQTDDDTMREAQHSRFSSASASKDVEIERLKTEIARLQTENRVAKRVATPLADKVRLQMTMIAWHETEAEHLAVEREKLKTETEKLKTDGSKHQAATEILQGKNIGSLSPEIIKRLLQNSCTAQQKFFQAYADKIDQTTRGSFDRQLETFNDIQRRLMNDLLQCI